MLLDSKTKAAFSKAWLIRSNELYILSKASDSLLLTDGVAQELVWLREIVRTPATTFHLGGLALELMLKSIIIRFDNKVLGSNKENEWFRDEKHDLDKLIKRLNKLGQIEIKKDKNSQYRFELSGNKILLSKDSYTSLLQYNVPFVSGRYPSRKLSIDFDSSQVLDFVYFHLRAFINHKLDIDKDLIDYALEGRLGTDTCKDWISSLIKNKNFGLTKSH